MEELEEWFKIKRYPHIGMPITIKDYNKVKNYVNSSKTISRHSFLPFIHKTILKRKFRAIKNNVKKNPSGKRQRKNCNPKVRNIFFASHLDSMIFSKYNSILTAAYENHIKDKPFNESIVAYRKIPIIKGEKGNKCNIDFAKSAFEFIKNNQNENLTVIIADITSFFDNLDHKILKKKWSEVLNEKTLPPDHYNIFKALTRIKYVESQQLFEKYDKTMIVERGVPNSSTKKEYLRKHINETKYFREKNAVAYCEKNEFLKTNLKLIISKKNETGIPQGSPISATLANIYMLDFDEKMIDELENCRGFYQRYCDDLIIVCEQKFENNIIKVLRDTISGETLKLSIEPQKTKLFHFEIKDKIFKGFAIDEISRQSSENIPLEFLGFSFDGQRVLIKNAGFSKFYRGMKGSFNRAASFALYSKNSDKKLFKSKLYKRFTYKGAKRKLIYRPLKQNPKLYKKTHVYDWGNYLSYIYKANDTMQTINGSDIIKKQSRKFWNKFHKLLKFHEDKIERLINNNTRR